jgi:hypothetical protein
LGLVAYIGEIENVYRVLQGKPEGRDNLEVLGMDEP